MFWWQSNYGKRSSHIPWKTNSNAVLSFSLINDELTSKIEILSDDKLQIASRSSEKPVCEGDGLAFIRCVKDYLKEASCVVVKTCRYCAYPCKKINNSL